MLFVADKTPRTWTDAEIALAQETLDRVWHVVERARAEEDLRLTTERFQLALRGSPVTLLCQDLDLRYTWISNPQLACAPSVGKLPGEASRGPGMQLRARPSSARSSARAKAEGGFRCSVSRRRTDLRSFGGPSAGPHGKITGVKSAAIDITALKQARPR